MRLLLPLLLSAWLPIAAAGGNDAERKAALRNLLVHDCGSCHGLTRKGGLGPSLEHAALRGKPREFLVHTIMEGRPGTAMPPWKTFLSRADVDWLVDELLRDPDSR